MESFRSARRTYAHIWTILAVMLWLSIVFAKAWMNEDAFITYRVVDNAIHGFGLRWNVHERVQAYTNPLWMLLSILFFELWPNGFQCGIAVGLLCSAAAAWLVLRQTRTLGSSLAVLVLLCGSRSVSEYATGGLENSLEYLLYACLITTIALHERIRYPTFCAVFLVALALLTRLDMVFLFGFPVGILVGLRILPFSLRQVGLGLLPIICWLLFATFYYGSPLPDTYFAKLSNTHNERLLAVQGLQYLRRYFRGDWMGAFVLLHTTVLGVAALMTATWKRSRSYWPLVALIAGIWSDIVYVTLTGGDYMMGRFLTAASFAGISCIVLSEQQLFSVKEVRWMLVGTFALACLLCIVDKTPVGCWIDRQQCELVRWHIQDNWLICYPEHGLMNASSHIREVPATGWARQGRQLREHPQKQPLVLGGIGQVGYYAGPETTIIDSFGLSDALIARIPMYMPFFLAGHRPRQIPQGYIEAVASGNTAGINPALREYFKALRRITQGPLWNAKRLQTIVLFQMGYYDEYMRDYVKNEREKARLRR